LSEKKVKTTNTPKYFVINNKKKKRYEYLFFYGGHNWARTSDPLLVRQVLSQLSYAPLW
jgi:hypothetical protein